MRHVIQLALLFWGCTLANLCVGQQTFKDCAAAFVDSKMIVNEYTTKGTCSLPTTATGKLTVNTIVLSPTESKAVDRIAFKIAIRDKATQTLVLFSKEEFKQVPVQKVLAKCRKGDRIVLLTLDDSYALPHNEILVQ
ncbi:hypothetical protein EXU85_07960 [Spirosoma sp. KCTC 42546]|uniref:hypothetical protein n=1 Tax=Spirosoma sp. KCTC 42546 TaxID=2520506 RepID=UPI00115B5E84|nr:hypothetical protein [Spirosoma sp. KCTC 42546]QDK78548.1 hypothetical protein EXU85_07960 [Spirosoma sp. KCTC 42546]